MLVYYPLNRYTWLECIVLFARAKQVLGIDTINYVCAHFEHYDLTLVSLGAFLRDPPGNVDPRGLIALMMAMMMMVMMMMMMMMMVMMMMMMMMMMGPS